MSAKRLFFGAALWVASTALAQAYVVSTSSSTYASLTGATPVTLSHPTTGLDPLRYGRATIPIGFDFPFFGKVYREITVTAHGMAMFEPNPTCPTCTYNYNYLFPYTYWPNGIIAPMWDDLRGGNANGAVQYQSSTVGGVKVLSIEWVDWNQASTTSTYSLTFTVRLYEHGVIEFHYGPLSGTGTTISAGVGIEDSTGTQAVVGKTCTRTPTNSTDCALTHFTANELLRFGPPAGADILAPNVLVNSMTATATDLQVSTTVRLRNFGQAATGNFTYKLVLSTNTTYEVGSDIAFNPASQGPFTLAPLQLNAHTATSTVPKPATGAYFILAVLDDTGAVTESNENNNVVASVSAYVAGIDLVALDITGPASGGPGDSVTNSFLFSNQGFDAAGTVGYKIWLSADTALGVGDHQVHSGTLTVAGGQTVQQNVTYTLPANIPQGDYFFILQLDDGPAPGSIVEASDANNVKNSSGRFNARQAELLADVVQVTDPTAPFLPADPAFFGENARYVVSLTNRGGATARAFAVQFHISDNDRLNATFDPYVGDVQNLTLAPAQTIQVVLTAPVPTQAANGTPLVPGDYYFFAATIGNGFPDVVSKSELVRVRGPAPDLVGTTLLGPQKVGAGELMLVTRTLRNIGNRPAGAAPYRYFLSANTLVTEDDILLPIVTASGEQNEGTVTLGVGAEDLATEVVRVPGSTANATYYLGVLIDPPGTSGSGQVLEISETNNGFTSQTLNVVAPALKLVTSALPDAVVGLPYDFRLSASGGADPYTYSIKAGAGDLPNGLSVAADGRITGTPTDRGLSAFSVVVESQGKTAEGRLLLRTLPLTSSLTVTSSLLPPLVRLASYEYFLAAQGGVEPYRWYLDSGTLPAGLTLTEAGRLAGLPNAALGTKSSFVLRVRDAVGNTDAKQYELTVVDATSILISTPGLPSAVTGTQYVVDIVARNANNQPLAPPLVWRLASGSLPPGLTLEPEQELALIQGTPTQDGNYPFTLEVQDGKGRADSADFILVVYSQSVTVKGELPAQVRRGEELNVQLQSSSPSARFSLFGGAPPPGISLSPEGQLSGTVADEAPYGPYNFTVAARAASGSSLAIFRVEVVERPGKDPCGCSSGAELGLGGLLVLAQGLWRRRRRSSRR